MNRAAVIIAVKKAGPLQELKAAIDGANKMEKWAHEHQFEPVIRITDEHAPVTAKMIKDAITKIVTTESCEQLFLYFAGHGVNLSYTELWLLSDAPGDTQEAVNVAGSVQLAKRGGIPHVVVVSDACRTAPEGIQAQGMRGSEIFRNERRGGPQKAVDVFYAALLGEPALEIQDEATAASRYISIYTDELVAALSGERKEILTPDPADPTRLYLRPQPLKRHLTRTIPELVAAKLGPAGTHTQTPDAEILSDEFAFLEEFVGAPPPAPSGLESMPKKKKKKKKPGPQPAPTLADVTALALSNALHAPAGTGGQAVAAALQSNVRGSDRIASAVGREATPFGTTHFETRCGFKLRGAAVTAATTHPSAHVKLLDSTLVRVEPNGPAADVVLELSDGRAMVLPAIRGFICSLTFEDGELRNASYDPSEFTERWDEYVTKSDELRTLRALIASSVQMGTFRLQSDDAQRLTDRIRLMKGLDPTLSVYAAYSYHRLGRGDLIRDMEQFVAGDLGVTLFDLRLLADYDPGSAPASRVVPIVPMLAQGWQLLGGFEAWTPLLAQLHPHVVTKSLWTLFRQEASPLLLDTVKGQP